jgi:hypothetical protein
MTDNEQNEGIIQANLEALLCPGKHRGPTGFICETMRAGSDVCPIKVEYDPETGRIYNRYEKKDRDAVMIMIGKILHGGSDILWKPEHYEGVNHKVIFVVPPNFGTHPGDAVLEESFERYNALPEDGVRK